MFPHLLAPQLCTLVTNVALGDEWLHEIKYDGRRLLARKDGNNVRLFTRSGVEWSARLPELVGAIRQLRVRKAWLDGELVCLDEKGYPHSERVMRSVRASNESALYYQVWDLPWRNDTSLTDRPLIERKKTLSEVLSDAPPRVRYTNHVTAIKRNSHENNPHFASDPVCYCYHATTADSRFRPGWRQDDQESDWDGVCSGARRILHDGGE